MTINNKTPYEEIFGVPADPEAGKYQDSLHAIAIKKELESIRLRQLANMNTSYANAIEHTIATTGHGSLYMAELHRILAAKHIVQSEAIFPSR